MMTDSNPLSFLITSGRVGTVWPALVATLVLTAIVAPAPALGQAGDSLNDCQQTVASESRKYVRAVADTIGQCLLKVSAAVIVDGGTPHDEAATCLKRLAKITNSASPGKTLSGRFHAKISSACDPSVNPGLSHDEIDVYTVGPTSLGAANLGEICQSFGGDGEIDSFAEWRDCILASSDCQARQGVAIQWPRVLEYTAALLTSPAIAENADAQAALAELDAAIEGTTDDDLPEIACGPSAGFPGDATTGEVLAGATFSSTQGTALTGTMPNHGAVTLTPGTTDQPIALGYHDGSGSCAGDADLTAGNIRSGANVFGVAGTALTASGNAAAGEVLSGQTFSNASGAGTGTMPNNGAVSLTPGTTNQAIAAGYHNGSGSCAGDADLTAGNIRSGANVFGVSGSVLEASGNAAASDVRSGQTFSNASGAGTGTMPNNGAVTLTPSTTNQAIAAGHHNGAGSCAGDADLTAGNIRSGANLFGVSGSVLQASGNAAASDVRSGQTFSNASGSGTGTMPNNGAVTLTPGTTNQTIAAGYHDGAGVCAGDADLTENSIRSRTTMFGVEGVVQPGPLKTGIDIWHGPGSDGDLEMGAGFRMTNNFGDGTVFDHTTGLMWEKKSNDGSVHDKDNTYSWAAPIGPRLMGGTAVTQFLAELNSGSGFAGYTDWRIPNVNELMTLARYTRGDTGNKIAGMLNDGCPEGCTVLQCSCTKLGAGAWYMSSTSNQAFDGFIYGVDFDRPKMDWNLTGTVHVRAVRGGYSGCTHCANENGTCEFSNERLVRYGANGKYVYASQADSTVCNNASFGTDPAPGVPKRCEICEAPVAVGCCQNGPSCLAGAAYDSTAECAANFAGGTWLPTQTCTSSGCQ